MRLHQLDFDLNLRFGYRKRTEPEPDLLRAQDKLRWYYRLRYGHANSGRSLSLLVGTYGGLACVQGHRRGARSSAEMTSLRKYIARP